MIATLRLTIAPEIVPRVVQTSGRSSLKMFHKLLLPRCTARQINNTCNIFCCNANNHTQYCPANKTLAFRDGRVNQQNCALALITETFCIFPNGYHEPHQLLFRISYSYSSFYKQIKTFIIYNIHYNYTVNITYTHIRSFSQVYIKTYYCHITTKNRIR